MFAYETRCRSISAHVRQSSPDSDLGSTHFSGKGLNCFGVFFFRPAAATPIHNCQVRRPRKGVSKVERVQGKGKDVFLIPADDPYHQPSQPDQIDQSSDMFVNVQNVCTENGLFRPECFWSEWQTSLFARLNKKSRIEELVCVQGLVAAPYCIACCSTL